jgi:hypothetical protein
MNLNYLMNRLNQMFPKSLQFHLILSYLKFLKSRLNQNYLMNPMFLMSRLNQNYLMNPMNHLNLMYLKFLSYLKNPMNHLNLTYH